MEELQDIQKIDKSILNGLEGKRLMDRPYNPADVSSIEAYAIRLIDRTFLDVIMERTNSTNQEKVIEAYSNKARKGGLGNLLEEVYFGYKANSKPEADFNEAGLELKATPFQKDQLHSLIRGTDREERC